ncbi:MAG: hypothetical protein P4L53_15955 [Candidatus Obscuribacterales bacterium]|nr:hypothetical protein [Candidatus Obscuribacterales bacterium]
MHTNNQVLNETVNTEAVDAEHVLALAASNPLASAPMLEALASSESAYVRSKVAENENTPDVILDALMHDCTSVKVALAGSSRAIERVWLLLKDDSSAVRMTLAANRDLPEHVHQVLTKDADRRVARCARRTLNEMRSGDSPVANLFKLFTRVA